VTGGRNRPRGDASSTEGDIVVTPLAGLYAIGRVTANATTQSLVEMQPDLTAALHRACALAGDAHRVFLAHPTRRTSVLVDCTELGQYAENPRARTR
jgi:hypothetical protein